VIIKTLKIGNEKMDKPGKDLGMNWEGNPTRFLLHEHPFVKRSEWQSNIWHQALNLIAKCRGKQDKFKHQPKPFPLPIYHKCIHFHRYLRLSLPLSLLKRFSLTSTLSATSLVEIGATIGGNGDVVHKEGSSGSYSMESMEVKVTWRY